MVVVLIEIYLNENNMDQTSKPNDYHSFQFNATNQQAFSQRKEKNIDKRVIGWENKYS